MMLNINDRYRIEIDSQHSHIPYKYDEGGEVISQGKFKGQLTKGGWKKVEKYFRTVGDCLNWIAQDSMLDDYETLDVKGYLEEHGKRMEELKNISVNKGGK